MKGCRSDDHGRRVSDWTGIRELVASVRIRSLTATAGVVFAAEVDRVVGVAVAE
jgi:hypothetical protein